MFPYHYMSRALHLAEQGRYSVSPNPMVGCVIVKNDQIIAEGFHLKAGEPHAEIVALHRAGLEALGATAYITLEPCCHYGKTPPCTKALIKAGIKEIYIACLDHNPLMSGKSIELLRAAGITINVGLMEDEAIQLNEIFFHYIQHKRPFVIAKWAMSLDGKTITHPSDTCAISSSISRRHAHQTRLQVDAILIGATTAKLDNPLLTARYATNQANIVKQPTRFILSRQGQLLSSLKIFDPMLPSKTIVVVTQSVDQAWYKQMEKNHIEVLVMPYDQSGKVALPNLLDELGRREITSLLVEGGMTVLHQFFNQHLINKVQVYVAPMIIGSLEKKQILSNVQFQLLENDFYFSADYPAINHPVVLRKH